MIRILALILLLCPIFALANSYDRVAKGYESSDEMYVTCSDFSQLELTQANGTLKKIFEQYEGEPGEILVYFVSDNKYVCRLLRILSSHQCNVSFCL